MQAPDVEPGDALSPLDAMRRYHGRIADVLRRLDALALASAQAPAPGAAQEAHALLAALDEDFGLHLADEEEDMFPAVLAACDQPGRRAQAFALVSALLVEHRELAEHWHALRVALLALGSGIAVPFPVEAAHDFVARLRVHIEREDFELCELLRLLDPRREREIAMAIARRHAVTDGAAPPEPGSAHLAGPSGPVT